MTVTTVQQEQRNIALRETMLANDPNSRAWTDEQDAILTEDDKAKLTAARRKRWTAARDGLLAENERGVEWVTSRLMRWYLVPDVDRDDVRSETLIATMRAAATWNMDQSFLLHMLQCGRDQARAWRESNTGYGGAVAVRRRFVRTERVGTELARDSGRAHTDEEVVAEANRRAHLTQRDPKRSGSLTTVNEHRLARQRFSDSSIDQEHAFGSISSPGDNTAETVVNSLESAEIIRHVAHALDTCEDLEAVRVFRISFRLDEPDWIGEQRPWDEVAALTGLSAGRARAARTRAMKVIREHLNDLAIVPA